MLCRHVENMVFVSIFSLTTYRTRGWRDQCHAFPQLQKPHIQFCNWEASDLILINYPHIEWLVHWPLRHPNILGRLDLKILLCYLLSLQASAAVQEYGSETILMSNIPNRIYSIVLIWILLASSHDSMNNSWVFITFLFTTWCITNCI